MPKRGRQLGRPEEIKDETLSTQQTEIKCPACDGTGFPTVTQPVQPGRQIYPRPCEECGGKGRITEAAN
jgi:DnaJ-class molecular chaperone